VREGDTVCLDNQKLRLQTQDPVAVTRSNAFYTPSLMDDRSPINWVDKIQVPTFLASAWQDEQTGPGFATMLDRMPNRPDVKITVVNGVHSSALEPQVLWNWLAFLDLYVARRVPGGDRTRWRFDTPPTGGMIVNDIGLSRVVLPVIPGVDPPATLPPCPGLRGQPCRTYVPAANGG